jgi:hypothetical protein
MSEQGTASNAKALSSVPQWLTLLLLSKQAAMANYAKALLSALPPLLPLCKQAWDYQ